MGNQNHSLGFTKMSNILHKRYVKWNKIGSTSFTLDLLPIAEFRSEPWARVHLSKWSPNSSPSLSSLGPLWSACWWVSTPWVQAFALLECTPFPFLFQSQLKFHWPNTGTSWVTERLDLRKTHVSQLVLRKPYCSELLHPRDVIYFYPGTVWLFNLLLVWCSSWPGSVLSIHPAFLSSSLSATLTPLPPGKSSIHLLFPCKPKTRPFSPWVVIWLESSQSSEWPKGYTRDTSWVNQSLPWGLKKLKQRELGERERKM